MDIEQYKKEIEKTIERFGSFVEGNILAARNPAFIADTVVWNNEYYIKYNMFGEIEECNTHNIKNQHIGLRITPPISEIRPACDIEKNAFRMAIIDKFDIDIFA